MEEGNHAGHRKCVGGSFGVSEISGLGSLGV